MKLNESEQATKPPPKASPGPCTHGRLISDFVSEEEHKAGKVHCVECGSVILDPHLQQESKET